MYRLVCVFIKWNLVVICCGGCVVFIVDLLENVGRIGLNKLVKCCEWRVFCFFNEVWMWGRFR